MQQPKRFVTVSVVVLLTGLLAACGAFAVAPTSVPAAIAPTEIVFKADEFSLSGVDQFEAGIVAITVENAGKEPHAASFFRLKEGKSVADLSAVLPQGPQAALAIMDIVDGAGGTTTAAPAGRQRVVLTLKEGNYVVTELRNASKGMLKAFKVVARTSQATVTEPTSDINATLKDFAFDLSAKVKAGQQTIKITNAGPQPHELVVVRLAAGKTMQDLLALINAPPNQPPAGPPPFEGQPSRIATLMVGQSAWVPLDFPPGNYVFVCGVPDPATGKPHALLGMLLPFTVE